MIHLLPYRDSKVLMATRGKATIIVLPFSGGYEEVLMFFMHRRNHGKQWSPSVMIPVDPNALRRISHEWTLVSKFCEELIAVAKDNKTEIVCWGQVKKGRVERQLKKGRVRLGKKAYVMKRHMFLRILREENVSIKMGNTYWIKPREKKSTDLPYIISLPPKDAIRLANSIMRLLKDFKPIKLPRPFNQSAKEKLRQKLLELTGKHVQGRILKLVKEIEIIENRTGIE